MRKTLIQLNSQATRLLPVTSRPRRPPPPTAGSRKDSTTNGLVVGSRGSRFATLTPEASYDGTTALPTTVESPRNLVGYSSSGTDPPPTKSLSSSSSRDARHTQKTNLGVSGSRSTLKGMTLSPGRVGPSLGSQSSTGPALFSPPQQACSVGQSVSPSPAYEPPPIAPLSAGLQSFGPSTPADRAIEPNLLHVDLGPRCDFLPSHATLAVEIEATTLDTPMEDPVPLPETMTSHDPIGQEVPDLAGTS
ncbi:hypothetical protein K2173_009307 [Erythroxylum novogranatense]|uniref:Uncharacterized protein n=1 Tax=Erythroxylum novogranatense TaxID=1862640 RepID=A0AAV8U3L1_9ROSI|nr:hypothetical protein K2173_009307 [Erythroxylum novogranatense]